MPSKSGGDSGEVLSDDPGINSQPRTKTLSAMAMNERFMVGILFFGKCSGVNRNPNCEGKGLSTALDVCGAKAFLGRSTPSTRLVVICLVDYAPSNDRCSRKKGHPCARPPRA